jgi:hypothetical protein
MVKVHLFSITFPENANAFYKTINGLASLNIIPSDKIFAFFVHFDKTGYYNLHYKEMDIFLFYALPIFIII